ncbi:exodeoxyribonuclease VII small subunit [Anaerobacillus alkalidiazotrophicus]|uniref:Exodeoxyribonuclease 7 small subunit n=2 Tax=Anaerobacillus TaxID=704093 RepID=A0A1S2M6A6_9BACI|nr:MULTISPECIES: exodeoxyribonuclease VII small subunit [Anaerobacillus]OIJ16879.1 exodeoxyribonuclease VII small subunit [Anaerobacillus alkalilacustris]OIJ20312.1 exodeoxyribonuclease VII small subunit [Anaerobacillus alkalidiazotrophicus]
MSEKKDISFEEAMEKLEEVVGKLEQGDVPLEEAISMFQEGMTLSKFCHDKLKNVEKSMDRILREDGELEFTTFQEE